MFSSKKGNIIVSLLIAIALWVYVVGEIDPVVTEQFKNVPIQLLNEQSLTDRGLSVLSQSDNTMTISISAKRSVMNRINASDITATVDLNDVAKGENELKIDVKIPEKTEMDDKSINKIILVIEESITRDKPVKVEYTGKFQNNEEPETQNVAFESLKVTGAESQVNKVDHIVALVPASKVKDDVMDVDAVASPVDAKGNKVADVTLEYKKVRVSTVLKKLKTVPLNVPLNGENEGDGNKKVTAPKTIIIRGIGSALDKVESINTQTVDLTTIEKSTEVKLVPILPEGIEMSSNESSLILKVNVTEPKIESKDLSFTEKDVTLDGLDENLTAKIKNANIKVTVSGTKSQLKDISKADIALSVDASKLKEGTKELSLNVNCDKENSKIQCDINKIEVTIE